MATEETITGDKTFTQDELLAEVESGVTAECNGLPGNSFTADDTSCDKPDTPVTSSNTGAIVCERCGVTFTSAVYRDQHRRLCRGQRCCPRLVEPLSVPTDIQALAVVQDGRKVFRCSLCAYSTPRGGHMTRHLLSHMGARPFTCIFCGKGFTQGAGLAHHIRIHSGDKPFRCDECDFACGRAIALKRHKNTHTREVMFACSHCSYTTSQAYNLRVHLRTHSGERPYQCAQCDYRAASTCAMRKHERNKHTPKLLCRQCPRIFPNQEKLDKHTVKKHSGGETKRKRKRKLKKAESSTGEESESWVKEKNENGADTNCKINPDLVQLNAIDASCVEHSAEIVTPDTKEKDASNITDIIFHKGDTNSDMSDNPSTVVLEKTLHEGIDASTDS